MKLESMREGKANRIAAGKPRAGMALAEGGNVSGNIFTAHRSTGISGMYLKFWYTNTHSVRKKGMN